ncbi:hypothetical protein GCM10027445_48310 [Amycolatopsis endophytica]
MRMVVAVAGLGLAMAGCARVTCPAIGSVHHSHISFPAAPEVATVELRLCRSGTCHATSAAPDTSTAGPEPCTQHLVWVDVAVAAAGAVSGR